MSRLFQRLLCFVGDHEYRTGARALVYKFPYYVAVYQCKRCEHCGKADSK